MGDMQVSSEYVAYSLHYLSYISGGIETAVISHSQGGPDTQWALRFWPSTQNVTGSFVALSPDFAGIDLLSSKLSNICVGDLCQASLWQQSDGSNYYEALHYEDFAALVPTTVVWSLFDEVVTPAQKNAALPSAEAISVQDLCPGRLTDHVFMTIDAAGFALALDALKHDGTASLTRVLPSALSVCLRTNAKHMQVEVATQLEADLDDLINGFMYVCCCCCHVMDQNADVSYLSFGEPRVSAEPAVMAYALPPTSRRLL